MYSRKPGVLGEASIRARLEGAEPMVERLRNPGQQIQPNGEDLTIEAVLRLAGRGTFGDADQGRELPTHIPPRARRRLVPAWRLALMSSSSTSC